ncbi:radical SAM protein [bacterium]|nr:radical SAM protein [bacterium]
MKVNLISPRSPVDCATEREKAIQFSRLSLSTVAAWFPPEAEVRIINDNIEEINFDEKVDLIGITALTSTAPRAYEIADKFRERKIPVILGGIHPSALPEEASKHADSVVIGEAEGVMENLINDFRKGSLKKFYSNSKRIPLINLPLPRKNLIHGSKFYREWNMVQTTRGCPFSCDFCSVSTFFGRTYRTRPVSEVIREIKQFPHRTIFFVDDNITGHPEYAKKLFKSLIPLRIRWFGQSSITIAKDRELLRLASKSGCFGLFIGFESLSSANLKSVSKGTNHVEEYREAIKKIHDYGIGIVGAFIFGFDLDDTGVFEETVKFIDRNQLELASFSILTPLPGTRLYEKMEREGRIIEKDWAKYTCGEVVFHPKLMSVEQLQEGYYWARKQISSYASIFRRTLHLRKSTILSLPVNLMMRKATRAFLKRKKSNS